MLGPRASKSAVEKVRAQYGLDQPAPRQYLTYIEGVVRLDFGVSFSSRRPVRTDLGTYLPATIELGLYAFILSALIGIPLGVASAVKRDTFVDHISRFVSISGLALPVF